MGSVWEGEHQGLKTNVAVKFVLGELGDNEEALTRFAREATATARIKSPHVVQVFDHGKNEEGFPYMVMEFLEGEDLEARLEREGKLVPPLAFQIVLQTAKALAKAHDLGIVHRDMKPSNVFLMDVEGDVFVKVLDFGIAKLAGDDPSRMSMTQTGAVIGTPYFMAPEQMTSAKDAGPSSDVWSLGVIGYRALTGRLPYEADTLAGLAMAIERGNFPPVSSLVNDLPSGIDDWFKKAIAKDPADRYATVREMAEELGKIVRAQLGNQVFTSSNPPPSLASPKKDLPTREASQTPPVSGPTLSEAKTLSASTGISRPLTEMSSTKALAARQSRSSSRRLVFVGLAAATLGSLSALGYYVWAARQMEQGAAGAPSSSAKPDKTQGPKPMKPTADPTSEPSVATDPIDSADPVDSAQPVDSASPDASASASASARPVPPRPPPPRPPPPGTGTLPTASPTAAPTSKPSAAPPPPPPKPASSAPAPKPSASNK